MSINQNSGAVWKSRWTSWAPAPNKPTVSVDVKRHFNYVHKHNSSVYTTHYDKRLAFVVWLTSSSCDPCSWRDVELQEVTIQYCWFNSMSSAVIEFCSFCLWFTGMTVSFYYINFRFFLRMCNNVWEDMCPQARGRPSYWVWCFIMTSLHKTPLMFDIKITGISKLKWSFQNISRCNTITVFAINTQTVLFLDHAHSGLSTRAAYLYITQQVLNATPHTFMKMLVFCLNPELLSDGNYIKIIIYSVFELSAFDFSASDVNW